MAGGQAIYPSDRLCRQWLVKVHLRGIEIALPFNLCQCRNIQRFRLIDQVQTPLFCCVVSRSFVLAHD